MFVPLYDVNPLRHIRVPFVTWTIIALNLIIYGIGFTGWVYGGQQGIEVSFGVIPSVIEGTRRLPKIYDLVAPHWTLATYAFVHGGFMHLLGNLLFLFVFGDNVEDAMGHVRFALFFLLSAAFAGLAHVIAHPASDLPLVGASGAVAAVVSAYLLLHPRVKVWVLALGRLPLPLAAWMVLGFWALMQVYMVAVQTEDDVAWWAHVGGLISGAVLVLLFRRPGVPLFDRGLDLARAEELTRAEA
jgi:membrane associated rhomboid family serine protease